MLWGGRCLHSRLDPCREMENACPQPGSMVHVPCEITPQASIPLVQYVLSKQVTKPADEAIDWRERVEGTLFVLPSMDQSNPRLLSPVQPGWKITLLPRGFRHVSNKAAHLWSSQCLSVWWLTPHPLLLLRDIPSMTLQPWPALLVCFCKGVG